eukprot:m.103359 g.103359  ORF g.103359 m.103359 type:complete len:836 (+) comp20873_c0_seq2:41-2548(+)
MSSSSSDSSDSEAEAESRRRDAPRKSASPLPAEATAVVPGPAASPPVRLSGDSKRDDAMGESSEGRNSSKRGAIRDEKEKRMVRRDPQAEARARGKTRTAVIDPTSTRSGGAYVPPARLRQMQADASSDKTTEKYQRLAWNALKKSINGMVNKVNVGNLQHIVLELFQENLVRGRGLFCRSVMKAQMASQTFTHVYAAMIAVVNTKLPQDGELLLKRLVLQFRKSYRRSDKATCLGVTKFIAHLANQQVAHEVLALEILTLLLETPTNDSVECAIAFLKECGQYLTEVSPKGMHSVFERMRSVLHEGDLDKRTQYMIEVMFAVRKDGFKDHPKLAEGLDLVEESDQITHLVMLSEEHKAEQTLDVFKFDPDFEANESKYTEIRSEILGEGSDGSEADSDDSDEDDSDDDEGSASVPATKSDAPMQITDMTEEGLRILRRTIYLTIMSSASFEECAHKLLKMTLKAGYEMELANMVIECCTQERSYLKFYGLLAARFCELQREYQDAFCQAFLEQYQTVHRLETNKLRQMAKLFAHLFFTDAVPWNVLEAIRLTESDTTSSSRIFIKELMLQMSEYMGVPTMVKRFSDPFMQPCYGGLFPKDTPKNTRFAVNFFTSIGLGGLTDDLREHLKNAPKMIMAQRQADVQSDTDSDSDSDSSSSSDSDSDSSSSSGSSSSSSSSSGSSSSSDSDTSENESVKPKKKAGFERAEDRPKELNISGEEAFAMRARMSGRAGDAGGAGPSSMHGTRDNDDGARGKDDRDTSRDGGRGRDSRRPDRDGPESRSDRDRGDRRGRGGDRNRRDDRDRQDRRSRSPDRRARRRSPSPDRARTRRRVED